MKNNAFLYASVLILSGHSLFGQGIQSGVEDKSVQIGASFYVGEETDVAISGDLDINSPNLFVNSGHLYFNNEHEAQIDLPSGELGSGEFIFVGSKDYKLQVFGDQARMGTLKMEMPSGMVNLTGNLVLPEKLELSSGIINVSDNSLLLIDNPSIDAVVFNNSPINKSYISGFLTRNMSAGKRYLFPVGSDSDFHPFLIDKPENSAEVRVSFDESVPLLCNDYKMNQNTTIEKSVGWRVESDSEEPNDFIAGLSILNTSFEESVPKLDIFYVSDLELKGESTLGEKSINKSTLDAFYLLGSISKSYGLYAFSRLLDADLVNFLYVGNDNKTRFEIPNQADFSNIRLNVFNRIGSMIFKSDHYINEFDARNYPDGTYFYELTLEKDNQKSIIRNFIDIKHEK